MEQQITPNAWLRAELSKRQSANARYSLRTFAKAIQVSPGRVSEWLSDKREISLRSIKSVTKILGYSPSDSASLIQSLFQNKIKTEFLNENHEKQKKYLLLNDQFQLVKEPYHYALMELLKTKDFREDYTWIAKRLKISEVQVKGGLERLIRVGLIERNPKNELNFIHETTSTTTDVSSAAIRESHRKTLQDTIECLENVPLEDRDITSITIAIDSAKIPMAKKMIKDFRHQLANFLNTGTKNEVYNLNVQLVPASFHCKEKKIAIKHKNVRGKDV